MRRFMSRGLALSLSFIVISACAPSVSDPEISIENASVRLPLPGQTTAAAYFDVVNAGGADVMLAASSPASPNVELHTHLHENGVMKMRRVESVAIPARTTTQFKSGGLHVMMFNAEISEQIGIVPVALLFEKSGTVTIEINTASQQKHGH
jgi:copper(I)-binding protein